METMTPEYAAIIFMVILILGFFTFTAYSKNKLPLPKRTVKRRKEKLQRLETLFLGKKLFLDLTTEDLKLMDENFMPVDLEGMYADPRIRQISSILPKKFLPLVVIKILTSGGNYGLQYSDLLEEAFEFEVLYSGDLDIIAKSPTLGEIYLPKRKYSEFGEDKKIKIKFNSSFDCYGYRTIIPEIV